MRQLSERLLTALYAQTTDEILLTMLKLSYEEWAEDIYLVRDSAAVSSGGQTYLPFPFLLTRPDEDDSSTVPVMTFVAQNVSQELIQKLRVVVGDVYCEVKWALRATPDIIESGPMDVVLRGIEYDAMRINGKMMIDPILEEPYGYLRMTPANTPGIF